jgi:hypothetical protein
MGIEPAERHLCNAGDFTELERQMLRDLEITQKYMQRLTYKSQDKRFNTNCFLPRPTFYPAAS